MITLYHADTAVCAAKVRLTLFEKDIPWRGELLDLSRGDQFKPDYLALNPNGVVPTLLHDGHVLIESTVINEYLDETFPEKPLRPATSFDRARMRLWTKREDGIHDTINSLTTAILFRADLIAKPPEERAKRYENIPDPARRQKWRALLEDGVSSPIVRDALVRLARLFRDMEKELGEGQWLLGDTFTLADIGLVSFFFRIEMLSSAGIWRRHYPGVTEWFERCKLRSSFEAAIRAPIPEARARHFETVSAPIWPEIDKEFAEALAIT